MTEARREVPILLDNDRDELIGRALISDDGSIELHIHSKHEIIPESIVNFSISYAYLLHTRGDE